MNKTFRPDSSVTFGLKLLRDCGFRRDGRGGRRSRPLGHVGSGLAGNCSEIGDALQSENADPQLNLDVVLVAAQIEAVTENGKNRTLSHPIEA